VSGSHRETMVGGSPSCPRTAPTGAFAWPADTKAWLDGTPPDLPMSRYDYEATLADIRAGIRETARIGGRPPDAAPA